MPAPRTGDASVLSGDVDVTGGGVAKKHMNSTKAIIGFSNFTAAELGPVAQFILERMSENAAVFPSPNVSMATLGALVGDYQAKLSARASRATADVVALNAARAGLETVLGRLGIYVNGVAQGDAAVVEKSGFPSYSTARPALAGPPAAPRNLRLGRGGVSGSVLARYLSQRGWATHEVQTNTGNPDNEADWHGAGIFQGQKAELTGLTPGTLVWVRVRTVGLKGVMGDWSDPAEIMVV